MIKSCYERFYIWKMCMKSCYVMFFGTTKNIKLWKIRVIQGMTVFTRRFYNLVFL